MLCLCSGLSVVLRYKSQTHQHVHIKKGSDVAMVFVWKRSVQGYGGVKHLLLI